MLVSIKFSSEDAAKKAEGFELFKEVKLFDPIVLDGSLEQDYEDDYDECGPGYSDAEWFQSDFEKLKEIDPKAELACIANADEGTGLYPVVYSRADDTEVKSIVSPSSKTYHTFGEDGWFDSCDEILAQLEDGDFDF
jgi:hypothetical protein